MRGHWERRYPPLALAAVSAVALAIVLVAQFGFALEPCHLCTLQRMPHLFALVVASMAAVEARDNRVMALLLGVLAAIYATDAGIAFFHVGVERHWWESACAGGDSLAKSATGLLSQLNQGQPAPACDSVPFELFGVSIAGMNLIVSAILAVFSARAARQAWRRTWR